MTCTAGPTNAETRLLVSTAGSIARHSSSILASPSARRGVCLRCGAQSRECPRPIQQRRTRARGSPDRLGSREAYMPMPTIFFINLDRSQERRALMQAQANKLGLAFERIPAIDGTRQLPGWMVSQFLDDRGLVRGGLSEGEVGCYASHLLVMSNHRRAPAGGSHRARRRCHLGCGFRASSVCGSARRASRLGVHSSLNRLQEGSVPGRGPRLWAQPRPLQAIAGQFARLHRQSGRRGQAAGGAAPRAALRSGVPTGVAVGARDFRNLPCFGARERASGDDHPGRLEGPRLHGNAHAVEAGLGFAGARVVLRDGAAEARRRLAFLDEVNSRSSASSSPAASRDWEFARSQNGKP